VIGPLSKNLRRTLYERLAGNRVVRAEKSRILAVFPVRRWPAQDGSREAEVRRLMTQALVQHAGGEDWLARTRFGETRSDRNITPLAAGIPSTGTARGCSPRSVLFGSLADRYVA
jgi:hypothetical protein